MDSFSRLLKFAQTNKHVQDSIEIIEKALLRYKPENTCVSFNGGKDCTAILHLIYHISRKLSPGDQSKVKAFYAQLPHHFDEEGDFVKAAVQHYNLKLLQYSTSSLKESLCQLKKDYPSIEAIFIGTRNDDLKPGAVIPIYAPTDPDWPPYMRVNPILSWSYSQVWSFIKDLDIPYCDLYDQGYSSLGTKLDTVKNASLQRFREDGTSYYLPAWKLNKSLDERLNRYPSTDQNKDTEHS